LEKEESQFIEKYEELSNYKQQVKLLLRNIQQFVGLEEVRFNSLYQMVGESADKQDANLEYITIQMIRKDELSC